MELHTEDTYQILGPFSEKSVGKVAKFGPQCYKINKARKQEVDKCQT